MGVTICKSNDYSWREDEVEEYEKIKNSLISRVINEFPFLNVHIEKDYHNFSFYCDIKYI